MLLNEYEHHGYQYFKKKIKTVEKNNVTVRLLRCHSRYSGQIWHKTAILKLCFSTTISSVDLQASADSTLHPQDLHYQDRTNTALLTKRLLKAFWLKKRKTSCSPQRFQTKWTATSAGYLGDTAQATLKCFFCCLYTSKVYLIDYKMLLELHKVLRNKDFSILGELTWNVKDWNVYSGHAVTLASLTQ